MGAPNRFSRRYQNRLKRPSLPPSLPSSFLHRRTSCLSRLFLFSPGENSLSLRNAAAFPANKSQCFRFV
ncbi:hypothetical protein SLA2020_168030 [Shorea laevis]